MKRDHGVLEVRIVCANRLGLLVDVMEAVESRGLTVTHAKISCHSDVVFEYLSLEVRFVNSTWNYSLRHVVIFVKVGDSERRSNFCANCPKTIFVK